MLPYVRYLGMAGSESNSDTRALARRSTRELSDSSHQTRSVRSASSKHWQPPEGLRCPDVHGPAMPRLWADRLTRPASGRVVAETMRMYVRNVCAPAEFGDQVLDPPRHVRPALTAKHSADGTFGGPRLDRLQRVACLDVGVRQCSRGRLMGDLPCVCLERMIYMVVGPLTTLQFEDWRGDSCR